MVPARDGGLGPAVPFPLLGARLRGSRGFQRLGSARRDHTTYHKQHRTCAIAAGPSVGTFGVSFPLLKRGTRGTWLPTHLAQLEVFLAIDGHCIPHRYSLWKAKKSRSRTASRGYHPSITPRPALGKEPSHLRPQKETPRRAGSPPRKAPHVGQPRSRGAGGARTFGGDVGHEARALYPVPEADPGPPHVGLRLVGKRHASAHPCARSPDASPEGRPQCPAPPFCTLPGGTRPISPLLRFTLMGCLLHVKCCASITCSCSTAQKVSGLVFNSSSASSPGGCSRKMLYVDFSGRLASELAADNTLITRNDSAVGPRGRGIFLSSVCPIRSHHVH